jgi:hypothetical protein
MQAKNTVSAGTNPQLSLDLAETSGRRNMRAQKTPSDLPENPKHLSRKTSSSKWLLWVNSRHSSSNHTTGGLRPKAEVCGRRLFLGVAKMRR